jgi:hypothetical protein
MVHGHRASETNVLLPTRSVAVGIQIQDMRNA